CAGRGDDVPMNGHQQHSQFPMTRCYRCANKMHARAGTCAMPKTPTWLVDEAVCTDLLEHVLTVEYLTSSLEAAQDQLVTSRDQLVSRISQVETELREQKLRRGRLLAVIEQKGMNDLIEQQYDRANERYLVLSAELSGLRGAQAQLQPQTLKAEEVARYVAELRTILVDGSLQERQALLRQFVRRVVLHLDCVPIEYTFRPELVGPSLLGTGAERGSSCRLPLGTPNKLA